MLKGEKHALITTYT